jgi:hypothetical protein
VVRHLGKGGELRIRAKLVDIRNHKLEMEFVVEGDDKSTHILDAVSPEFTCSKPFFQYVCNTNRTEGKRS